MSFGRRRRNQFTIYDMMEERGIFALNPANADAMNAQGEALYRGPVEYPKMLYSPTGEMAIRVPAEIIVTPLGPKEVNEQRELVTIVVNNEQEELIALEAGWHLTPAESLKAGGHEAPPETAQQTIARLLKEKAELEAQVRNAALTRAAATGSAAAPGTLAQRLGSATPA